MALRRKHHDKRFNRKTPVEHTGFHPYLRHYLEARAVQGMSPATNNNHDNQLRNFIAWCDERSLDKPQEITKPIIERYQRHLYYYRQSNGEPLSWGAQRQALSIVKTFFRWLTQENHLLYNPASELVLPKRPRTLPRVVLSEADILTILNQPDTQTPEGIRDRAVLELFYSCGLRRSEMMNLCCHDVDINRQLLIVRHGKGNKDRYLPIGDSASAWLRKYLDDVRDLLLTGVHEPHLFLTDYGEAFKRTSLGTLVKKHIKQAGIDVIGSCHLFRHAMATHMLERGADVRFIQSMLGHTDLSTTEIYTHVSVEKLREIHRATHPAKLPGHNTEADSSCL